MKPRRPVDDAQQRRAASTIAPQAIIGELFQTIAMLVPIAVSASVRRSSSMGIENTLIAKAKAANSAADERSDDQHRPAAGVVKSMPTTRSRPGNGRTPKNRA